jgi:hypothetical protein
VNVISNSTDTDCRTPKLIRGRGEIFMEIGSDGWFGETGSPILCRKNEMKQDSR